MRSHSLFFGGGAGGKVMRYLMKMNLPDFVSEHTPIVSLDISFTYVLPTHTVNISPYFIPISIMSRWERSLMCPTRGHPRGPGGSRGEVYHRHNHRAAAPAPTERAKSFLSILGIPPLLHSMPENSSFMRLAIAVAMYCTSYIRNDLACTRHGNYNTWQLCHTVSIGWGK